MAELVTALRSRQEAVGRWTGFVVLGLAVANQLSGVRDTAPGIERVRWALVSVLFVLFWSAYWRRRPALVLASKASQILLPLVCSGLPLLQLPPLPVVHAAGVVLGSSSAVLWRPLFEIDPRYGLVVMAAAEACAVVAMLSLGRSFSIFSEVRELATSGLYRFVRHPLYLAEMIAVWGYLLLWPALWAFGCALLFTALQSWRARVEERLLLAHQPAYAGYRARTGFLLPRLRR